MLLATTPRPIFGHAPNRRFGKIGSMQGLNCVEAALNSLRRLTMGDERDDREIQELKDMVAGLIEKVEELISTQLELVEKLSNVSLVSDGYSIEHYED